MQFIRSFYITSRFYFQLSIIVLLFVIGHFVEVYVALGKVALFLTIILFIVDIILLYGNKTGIAAKRILANKLSNGDDNVIELQINNSYRFPVDLIVIDELPVQLQIRNFKIRTSLNISNSAQLSYKIKPVERGEYHFGSLNVYCSSKLACIKRRYKFEIGTMRPVYPSIIQMKKFEIFAISNRLAELGAKRIRRIGHTLEFDHIRSHVVGDDFRSMNWKATARKNSLMVNQYQDEKSQEVYSVINMGRVMKMPFEGMSLLDYAINASLVISNIILNKYDKAGIITFSNKIEAILKADRKNTQLYKILELLYSQTTGFMESDYEALYILMSRQIKQRSLIMLYTNFETIASLKRQLTFLRKVAQKHLLVVVFFENSALAEKQSKSVNSLEDIYKKNIAEKFIYEKRQIVRELQQYGIYSILTKPQDLTINCINVYLELKAKGAI